MQELQAAQTLLALQTSQEFTATHKPEPRTPPSKILKVCRHQPNIRRIHAQAKLKGSRLLSAGSVPKTIVQMKWHPSHLTPQQELQQQVLFDKLEANRSVVQRKALMRHQQRMFVMLSNRRRRRALAELPKCDTESTNPDETVAKSIEKLEIA